MKALLAVMLLVSASPCASPSRVLQIIGPAERFAPGVASTQYDEIRLTLSPDGKTALWFSRNRPGGPGGYDIWVSRHDGQRWRPATPVSFNTPGRDFDPAFSADGRVVYFCSDRAGGHGGDDLYRVSVGSDGRFGEPLNLGPAVNSAADEFAPMLSPDAGTLLFSSSRAGGAGGHDLYAAAMNDGMAQPAQPLPGDLNTAAQEFDATFLGDGRTVVFARALDFGGAPVRQFIAYERGGRYEAGHALPAPLNEASGDSYGAMLDGSHPDTLTYSARRADGAGLDLYRVRYRMKRP
ncbi:TPA: PD40 domain-containing protein [Stenotrophomonas maltophilia]|nr:PD40 domain-containing protein [Stenotrophomonas maltophilia]